jgi:hypothetical protein
MKISDTIVCVLSDMHTGSSTALFPNREFVGKHQTSLPNRMQKMIYPLWIRTAGEVAAARKGKRLIVINLGDAIDGIHHNSIQETLFNRKDQAAAHVQLMEWFLRRVGFSKGDELHYVQGTEIHVAEVEDDIAGELGAIPNELTGYKTSSVLELNINGTFHYFTHHGVRRGDGANEGNTLKNKLRNMYYDRLKENMPKVHVVWSGHTHGHTWATFEVREKNDFHQMHGIICPSWQAKTRYVFEKMPQAINSIGAVWMKIDASGEIGRPHFVVEVTKDV